MEKQKQGTGGNYTTDHLTKTSVIRVERFKIDFRKGIVYTKMATTCDQEGILEGKISKLSTINFKN